MQRILLLAGLIMLLGAAAMAQATRTVPCVVDVGSNGPDGKHLAQWQPRVAEKAVFRIAAGTEIVIPFSMPVDGRCEARFQGFDDREEMAVRSEDASGKMVTKRPKGDVEVLIVDGPGMAARSKDVKYTAKYSGGVVTDGELSSQLQAGEYFLIVSNKHSDKIPKRVIFWLGRAPIDQ